MNAQAQAEFHEDDYCIAGSGTAFIDPGEYGPLPCGCYLVVVEFDPVGPRMCLVMRLKTADKHPHTAGEFLDNMEGK